MSRNGRWCAAFALTLALTFASSGCGQKGPLFLPSANGVAGAPAGSASAATR